MRILITSLYFPPYNAMGSVRMGKLAKYLLACGHDVRILTARRPGPAETLPLEVPIDRVLYTPWWDINAPPKFLARILHRFRGRSPRRDSITKGQTENPAAAQVSTGRRGLSRFTVLYGSLLNWPDARVGWLPFALLAAHRHLKGWTPEIIYASRPPSTSLVVGRLLARRYGVPWVAELRDRWVDDPYRWYPEWRTRLEETLFERPTLGAAAAIVTVSEPWAQFYAKKYGKPTEVVYNGFDMADFREEPNPGRAGARSLRIVYTGQIYHGRRDPSALFRALQLMGAEADNVRVEFYGTEESLVVPFAARHDVSHLVAVRPQVPYLEAIAIQQRADVLLLMQWDDPREQGNVPGKLFEYLGARRPILGLGLENGVPAAIIRERSAGFFSNDPQAIAAQLKAWLETKRRTGHIAALPELVREGFSRDEQFNRLDAFLKRVARENL